MWPYKNIDMGIDLGTSKYSVYARGEGVIVTEPAYIAFRGESLCPNNIVEIGNAAKTMLGKCPLGIQVMSPMKDGVIIDTTAASILLQEVIRRANMGRWFKRRKVLVGSLLGASDTERRAFIDVAKSVGSASIHDIPEPLAAAAGCGLPIDAPQAQLIVDIGSGATEIVVVSLGDIVCGQSLRIGGDAIDENIERFIMKEFGLRIGRQLAKATKERLAISPEDTTPFTISGIAASSGLPNSLSLTCKDIRRACEAPIGNIVALVKSTLETLPPEMSADVMENGVFLSGGGALLPDIRERISSATGLDVSITERPSEAVVRGCAMLLNSQNLVS